MLDTRFHKDIAWVDLENPTAEEVRELIEKYGISPLVGNELLTPSIRSRADLYKNYSYVILQFPTLKDDGSVESVEMDFIIGKNFIITTRYRTIDALFEFSKLFEADSVLEKTQMNEHGGFIFYHMLKFLYRNLTTELEKTLGQLLRLEDKVYGGKERDMVFALSNINRVLLNFSASIGMHREILKSFEANSDQLFGNEFSYFARNITNEYYRVEALLEQSKEYLKELRATNDALLNTKQNEKVALLTTVAFLTLPATLIASLFNMQLAYIPIAGVENDFWIVIGIMAIAMLFLYVIFKIKKWL